MDLNQLYSEHQIALMRAADAVSDSARRRHVCAAGVIGGKIFDLLTSKNADAAAGWLPWRDQFGGAAGVVPA
ncbi:hypothetical protein NUH86_20740 [Sphingobium sp. JS3065]|jgi:hypothetical protein|uniref:hypothetical protein n=1 Tax=Sphingobium sp. JS3065 TaxID=2970925 RepID=UPI002264880A|nr:hypothetical protein [Sphingobium sp. JS3065]UZW57160.1 hypothetical protein NUH86_20740 [Sphingobium sp. JS3065]